MFQFTLDPCASYLRHALSCFMLLGPDHYVELCVTENDVTLVGAVGDPEEGRTPEIPNVVLALQLTPSNFYTFSCTENVRLGLDYYMLFRELFDAKGGDFLSLSSDISRDNIDFELLSVSTLEMKVAEIPLLSRRSGQITLPQLQKERPVVIGIAAELFRVLILSSRERFGMTVTVSVMGKQVVLHGQDKAIVLRKEDCVIWIPVAGRFFLKFSTENANALLNASILSNMVWLYGQCNGPSCMLNFPFGQLGSLTFYFGEDNAGSEDDAGFHKR
ncbi:hypothetical protein PRUPE_2G163700 [Prunus persica]|uniref:Uncharacterized protein n=1 Tax=Prunus persica TaxID=3760 RepID=A0A251QGN6_PRUPE|nr:uncharacterized protein LOC109947172 [Prunus persica]ONI23004.1 hypothetical protein PRUPE_2G163700 [Prunus persica]